MTPYSTASALLFQKRDFGSCQKLSAGVRAAGAGKGRADLSVGMRTAGAGKNKL
jgi:hypothetical protein